MICFFEHFGTILEFCWDCFGSILGAFWGLWRDLPWKRLLVQSLVQGLPEAEGPQDAGCKGSTDATQCYVAKLSRWVHMALSLTRFQVTFQGTAK